MSPGKWLAALAACALLPAAAQSVNYTPTPEEARQARENAARDARMADAMEKARLKEEAKPVSTHIPREEAAREHPAVKHPETFTAAVPGSKAAKKAKKKKR